MVVYFCHKKTTKKTMMYFRHKKTTKKTMMYFCYKKKVTVIDNVHLHFAAASHLFCYPLTFLTEPFQQKVDDKCSEADSEYDAIDDMEYDTDEADDSFKPTTSAEEAGADGDVFDQDSHLGESALPREGLHIVAHDKEGDDRDKERDDIMAMAQSASFDVRRIDSTLPHAEGEDVPIAEMVGAVSSSNADRDLHNVASLMLHITIGKACRIQFESVKPCDDTDAPAKDFVVAMSAPATVKRELGNRDYAYIMLYSGTDTIPLTKQKHINAAMDQQLYIELARPLLAAQIEYSEHRSKTIHIPEAYKDYDVELRFADLSCFELISTLVPRYEVKTVQGSSSPLCLPLYMLSFAQEPVRSYVNVGSAQQRLISLTSFVSTLMRTAWSRKISGELQQTIVEVTMPWQNGEQLRVQDDVNEISNTTLYHQRMADKSKMCSGVLHVIPNDGDFLVSYVRVELGYERPLFLIQTAPPVEARRPAFSVDTECENPLCDAWQCCQIALCPKCGKNMEVSPVPAMLGQNMPRSFQTFACCQFYVTFPTISQLTFRHSDLMEDGFRELFVSVVTNPNGPVQGSVAVKRKANSEPPDPLLVAVESKAKRKADRDPPPTPPPLLPLMAVESSESIGSGAASSHDPVSADNPMLHALTRGRKVKTGASKFNIQVDPNSGVTFTPLFVNMAQDAKERVTLKSNHCWMQFVEQITLKTGESLVRVSKAFEHADIYDKHNRRLKTMIGTKYVQNAIHNAEWTYYRMLAGVTTTLTWTDSYEIQRHMLTLKFYRNAYKNVNAHLRSDEKFFFEKGKWKSSTEGLWGKIAHLSIMMAMDPGKGPSVYPSRDASKHVSLGLVVEDDANQACNESGRAHGGGQQRRAEVLDLQAIEDLFSEEEFEHFNPLSTLYSVVEGYASA